MIRWGSVRAGNKRPIPNIARIVRATTKADVGERFTIPSQKRTNRMNVNLKNSNGLS
jgi:hypothetical protein